MNCLLSSSYLFLSFLYSLSSNALGRVAVPFYLEKRQNDKTTNALFRYYSKRYMFLFVGIISMDIMLTCDNGVSIGFCLVKSWNIGIVTVSKLSEM